MGFLTDLARQRAEGGPALTGAFTPSVRTAMTSLEKMKSQEMRYVQALAMDPDIAAENPQAAEALADFQLANRYGSLEEKQQAQESLWQRLVTAPGVRTALSTVAWVGHQLERGDRAVATFLRGAVDSMALDVQARASVLGDDEYRQVRQVLKAYNENPKIAEEMRKRLSPRAQAFIDNIPPEYRPVIGMNPFERITAGLSLDPQSLMIGEALISSEVAQEPLGFMGLKAGHLRLPADILLSPLTWLGGSGAKAASGPLSAMRAARVRVPVGRAIRGDAIRGRVLNERGYELYSKIWDQTYALAKARELRKLKADKVTFPGTTDQAKLLTEYAEREANSQAYRVAANKIQKLLDAQEDLLDRGGIFLNLPFVKPIKLIPGEVVSTPAQFIYRYARAHTPSVARAGEATYDVFDRLFNELPFTARKNFGYAAIKAQNRANGARSLSRLHGDIDELFADIPKDQAEAIGKWLNARGSKLHRSEDIRVRKHARDKEWRAKSAVHPKYMDIPQLIERQFTGPFAELETYTHTLIRTMDHYFPMRYKNHAEMNNRLNEVIARSPSRYPHLTARVAPNQPYTFERLFPDFDEAVRFAKDELGVELEPVLDFREALKIRAKEHVTSIEGATMERAVMHRFGRSTEEMNRIVFRQIFPQWALKVELAAGKGRRPTPQQIRRESKVGLPLRLFKQLHDTPAYRFDMENVSREGQKIKDELGRALEKMDDDERALFVVGAIRHMGAKKDLEKFEQFLNSYEGLLSKLSPLRIKRMRDEVTALKRTTYHGTEPWHDRFGHQWITVDEGPMKGHAVPRSIYLDIQAGANPWGDPALRKALRHVDLMTDFTKWSLTANWPAFHVRNFYSNIAQAFLEIGWASLNPKFHRHAMGIVLGRDGAMDVLGEAMPYAVLRQEMEIFGVIRPTGTSMDYIDSEGALRRAMMGGGFGKPGTKGHKASKAMGFGSEVGQVVENEARAMLYLWYRHANRGMKPENAAEYVNKVFADYGSLSWAERNVFKRLIPFWTWNKKNLAYQAKQVRNHPGRWTAMVRTLGEGGDLDYDTEVGAAEALLPEYALGQVRVGLHDPGGGQARFITGIDLPVESALELSWGGDIRTTMRAWVSMIHPVRSVLDAYGYQRDPFTGRELGPDARQVVGGMGNVIEAIGKALGPGGEAFKKALGYKHLVDEETGEEFKTVNAARYHVLMKGAFLARMAGTTDRLTTYVDDEGIEVLEMMLDFLGGFRMRDYDLTDKQRAVIQKNIKMLERLGLSEDKFYQFPTTGISRRVEQ